jgi:hypothetical protein
MNCYVAQAFLPVLFLYDNFKASRPFSRRAPKLLHNEV